MTSYAPSRAGHQKRLCLEIQGDLDRLRRDVDTTAALALLQDRGHSSYLSDIEQIEAEIKQDSFVRFRDARMRIDGMRQRLGSYVPFRTETERSLARLRGATNHPTIPRIERLLQQGRPADGEGVPECRRVWPDSNRCRG